MAEYKTNLVLSVTDKASRALSGIAGRIARVNDTMTGFRSRISSVTGIGKVGESLKQITEQTNVAAQSFQQVGEPLKKIGTAWSGFSSTLRTVAAGTAAVAAAGAGLIKFGKSASDAAQKVADLSKKYQISGELAQLAGTLVAESGGSFEGAAAAIGKLKKAQNDAIHGNKEAAAAFAGVGLVVEDLKKLKPEDILLRMSDAFAGSKNDLAKQAVLLKLMGKSGEDMMDSLNQGGDAWRKKLEEMRADGRIFTAEQLSASTKFDDAWNRTTGVLESLKNTLGLELVKTLEPFVQNIREWVNANRELIRSGFNTFLLHIPPLVSSIGKAFSVLSLALGPVFSAIKGIGHMVGMDGVVFTVAGTAVGALAVKFAVLTASLAPVLIPLAAIVKAMEKAYEISSKINFGGKWYDFIHRNDKDLDAKITPEEIARARAPRMNATPAPEAANRMTAPEAAKRVTAAEAASAQKQDIKNTVTVNVKVDGPGSATVENMHAGSPQTTINAKTGLALQGM
jgi:hypothetical protein